jgi:hypothetical protein
MRVLAAACQEPEPDLGFAGLHPLLDPALDRLDVIRLLGAVRDTPPRPPVSRPCLPIWLGPGIGHGPHAAVTRLVFVPVPWRAAYVQVGVRVPANMTMVPPSRMPVPIPAAFASNGQVSIQWGPIGIADWSGRRDP